MTTPEPEFPGLSKPSDPSYGAPQQQPYGAPQYGDQQYGGQQYGSQPYGDQQYGAPQYGAPQYGAPQYGAPQYGAPQPAYGYGAPYGADPSAPYGRDPMTGEAYSDKSKVLAGILQILLVGLGVGRFYTGHVGIGVAQLVVTLATCGFGAIWGLIDGIVILTSRSRDVRGYLLKP